MTGRSSCGLGLLAGTVLCAVAATVAYGAEVRPAGAEFTLPTSAFVVDGGTHVQLSGSTRLVLDCSLANYSTFAPSPGSAVVVSGFGLPLLSGVPAFADLTMNTHSAAVLGTPASVGGLLTLTLGRLSLAGHDLTVNAISGGSALSYVATPDTAGRLVRVVGGVTPVAFPVGNASYDPVTVRTGGPADDFRVAVMDAPPTGILTPSAALSRAWAIHGRNVSGADGTLSMTVQWNVAEQGATFDRSLAGPTSAVAWRWVNGDWAPQPGVRTTDNGLDPAVDALVTPHDGVWTLASYGALLGVDPPPSLPRHVSLAPVSPNPLHGESRVTFGLPRRAHVSLTLYSLLGERVATLVDGMQDPGWHTASLAASRLPGGVYFLRLVAGGDVRSNRVVVVR